MTPTCGKSWAGNLLILSDLTFGPSFKVKRWFIGFGELSFWWIQICIGSPMRRSSFYYFFYTSFFLITGVRNLKQLVEKHGHEIFWNGHICPLAPASRSDCVCTLKRQSIFFIIGSRGLECEKTSWASWKSWAANLLEGLDLTCDPCFMIKWNVHTKILYVLLIIGPNVCD